MSPFWTSKPFACRSQLPRGLRRRSAAARLLRLWVRIPPGAWISACRDCCVLSGSYLCDGLITRAEESGEVRVASRGQEIVSVASRVVNPKYDKLRPAVSKKFYQLHRKIWVYKMSNNWKVLTQFYCTLLYTQLYAHIQNCWMISTTQLLYRVTVWFLSPTKKIFSEKKTGTLCS